MTIEFSSEMPQVLKEYPLEQNDCRKQLCEEAP